MSYHLYMATPEDQLYELLNTPKKASGELPNNEDVSTAATMNMYDDPEDRPDPGESHSLWGDEGPSEGKRPNQAFHNSTGVYDEAVKDRQGVVKNVFHDPGKASKADQALIAENFAHGSSGDFTTHSIQLQPKSVEKISHPRTPTLMDQVRKIAGRV